jgi:hypothetical protein
VSEVAQRLREIEDVPLHAAVPENVVGTDLDDAHLGGPAGGAVAPGMRRHGHGSVGPTVSNGFGKGVRLRHRVKNGRSSCLQVPVEACRA